MFLLDRAALDNASCVIDCVGKQNEKGENSRLYEKTQENERVFGKGVMTTQRNQYRRTGHQKKDIQDVFFTLKMRADTSGRKKWKENCRNGNVRLLSKGTKTGVPGILHS